MVRIAALMDVCCRASSQQPGATRKSGQSHGKSTTPTTKTDLEWTGAAGLSDPLHFCSCGILAVIGAVTCEARMIRKLDLSVAVVALLGSLCSADTLRLKDGLSHSGTFVSATSHTIAFREG